MITIILIWMILGFVGFIINYHFAQDKKWKEDIRNDRRFYITSIIAHIIGGAMSFLMALVQLFISKIK